MWLSIKNTLISVIYVHCFPGNAEVWLKVILIGEIALPLPQEQKIQLLMVFLFIITEPFFFH